MTKVDKTHLSPTQAEHRGIIHRDLISHCFRWSHVAKWLHKGQRYKDCHILDIGCGKETPMPRTLYSNRLLCKQYVGLDANKNFAEFNFGKMNVDLHEETLFPMGVEIQDSGYQIGDTTYLEYPDLIVSFEVLEHVEPSVTREMLEGMFEILHDDGTVFISTPCYDENTGHAKNHPNEITRDALGALIEDIGFQIDGNWGTFASIKDYKPLMSDEQLEVFNDLRAYYDTNVLATIFAPLFPEGSRNNIWQLSKAKPDYERQWPSLDDVPGPWTSNDNWEDLAGEL